MSQQNTNFFRAFFSFLFLSLLIEVLSGVLPFIHFSALALELPSGLDHNQRLEVARLVGVSTSSKILSNPFPLGGYQGLEVGISLEVVGISDLYRIGDGTKKDEREFRYSRISVGKGLYNNVDFFLHFVPFSEGSQMSEYGSLLRWSFYEAKFLPINLSLLLHGSVLNINDSLNTQTLGSEIVAGISVNNFSLYFGGGFLHESAQFTAQGQDGIVSTIEAPGQNGKIDESLQETHSVVGMTVHFYDLFVAGQIDRYQEPVYSIKLGIRL